MILLFHDGCPFQMTPVWCFFRTDVIAAVKVPVLFLPIHQHLRMAHEILLHGRIQAFDKGLQRLFLLRNQLAIGVTHMTSLDVVFEHVEVAHLQGLFHHPVDIL